VPSNLAIDDKLLQEALRLGKLRTKRDTVNAALKEFVDRRRQREILKYLGTVEFRDDWDYKRSRRKRELRG
jgi:Arc/MetJ family transcription regulator